MAIDNISRGLALKGLTAKSLPSAFASLGVGQTPSTITAATATVPNDPSQFYLMNSVTAQALTVPSGLSAWPVGAVITAIQMGAGALTIVAGSGVTITNSSVLTAGQYKIMQLIKLATDTYLAKAG